MTVVHLPINMFYRSFLIQNLGATAFCEEILYIETNSNKFSLSKEEVTCEKCLDNFALGLLARLP